MKDATADLSKALLDVRRAFRLVHAYHARLRDLLCVIDAALGEMGFDFSHWEPVTVARLPNSKSRPFDRQMWAWDYTPAYQMGCCWKPRDRKRGAQFELEVWADTAFPEAPEQEPLSLEDAAKSRSELRFFAFRAGTSEPEWVAAWDAVGRLENWRDRDSKFQVGSVPYALRAGAIDLVDLSDDAAVERLVLSPVTEWLNAKP